MVFYNILGKPEKEIRWILYFGSIIYVFFFFRPHEDFRQQSSSETLLSGVGEREGGW
jgi:hypothetical protein